MKLRKASALFMAAAMSASMFVVPAAADETEDPAKAIPEDVIPDETVTLNVFDQLANYSGEQIGWFGQVMLEKFNVKLNIILTVMELMRHVWSQEILETWFSGEMTPMSISRQ